MNGREALVLLLQHCASVWSTSEVGKAQKANFIDKNNSQINNDKQFQSTESRSFLVLSKRKSGDSAGSKDAYQEAETEEACIHLYH